MDLDRLIARVRDLPHDEAVQQVDAVFRALPAAEARALAENRPEQVGRLDGAPVQLRYRANHLILVAAQQRLRRLDANGQATPAQRMRLETLDELLQPAGTRLDVDADGNRVVVEVPRQFLLVEPDGQGRLIEVRGDLENADNIAVLVPGMNNDLERARAQSVRAEEIRQESGPGTATVMWVGYYAPLDLEEGRSTERSRAAAPLLCRFQAGLGVVAPKAKVTLIGNSFGAQVVGRAMLAGARAHRYLVTGCPGVDPSITLGAQLTPPGCEFFGALRARGDYVSYAEQHGPDPASFPDVVRIATDNAQRQVTGHMSYFAKNSESMANVGRVVRGDLDAVTLAPRTTPAEETRMLGVSWAGALRTVAQSKAAVPIAKVFDGIATLRKVSTAAPRKTVARRAPRVEGPAR
ncbi:alpha/beta hydrolase [Kribbella sp. NPDC059898]|uniref:alpha/beta hydrolase n=1 Tax=Kribbella sp. NPDC059898 TaxID=3346995 RepID=UPI00365CCA1E